MNSTSVMISVASDQLTAGVLLEFSFDTTQLLLYVNGEMKVKVTAASTTNTLVSTAKPLVFGKPHVDHTGALQVGFTIHELSIWSSTREEIIKGESIFFLKFFFF